VKKACIEMIFSNWIHSTNSNLIEFLACLDVMANRAMAKSALACFFGMHAGMFERFNAQYLENLTVETAFILRVFCQHTLGSSGEGREAIQEMLPELTQMATYIHRAYESLLRCPAEDWEEGSEPGLVRAEVEFVLGELLLTCRHLDFADEVGRRVLEEVLLEPLTNLGVGDANFKEALALLRLQSPTQGHFYGLASGLVADFKDVYAPTGEAAGIAEGPEGLLGRSLESLRIANPTGRASDEADELPEDVLIMANLRALEVVREAFALASAMDADDSLMAMLVEAVIPAINSGFEAVQALGLLCLGLACSLSRDLAVEYAELFLDFISLAGTAESSEVALRIVFDMVLLYGAAAFPGNIMDALTLTLCDDRPGIQAVATEGFAKLLLHGIIPVDDANTLQILQGLLQLYYHPSTEGEGRLRQCLAYFLPAFALSKAANQRAVAKVAVPFLVAWIRSGATGIAFASIAGQLAHLTDASCLVDGASDGDAVHPHDTVLLGACWAVLEDPDRLAKALLCGLLPKLSLSAGLSPFTVKKTIMLLGQAARLSAVAKEKAVSTAANKLLTGLLALDDVETTLPSEEMEAFKERLKAILGTAAGPLPASQAKTSGAKPAAASKKAAKSESTAISNPLDDLDDILED
jgi:condensin complex subunit 3